MGRGLEQKVGDEQDSYESSDPGSGLCGVRLGQGAQPAEDSSHGKGGGGWWVLQS